MSAENALFTNGYETSSLFIFFNKDLSTVAILNKDYYATTKRMWEIKLKKEFNYDYDATSNLHPKRIYEQLIDCEFKRVRDQL